MQKTVKKQSNDLREMLSVSPEERRLLDFFRDDLKYGEAHVIVRKGLPVRIKHTIKEVKLDG